MSKFFTDYHKAYNCAVRQARETKRIVQLVAGVEYTTKGFYVRGAIQKPELRFGIDAKGEFISPSDPIVSNWGNAVLSVGAL